jgi:Flp pilus assembly protein TadG
MTNQQSGLETRRRGEQGTAIVFVTIALAALVGFAAWATETGRAWQAKGQLQAAADSAALAGVGNLLDTTFLVVDEAGARTAATSYGPQHEALGIAVGIPNADVDVGNWDLPTRTFTALPGNTDPDQMRAVRVRTRRDATANGPVQTVLGRAVGVDSIPVNTEAVAYWGWAGSGGPGVADLPIAIDCCAISGAVPGSACTQNYCQTIQNGIPNPCPLSYGGTATCLEFHSTPEQNACWTEFDGDHPAINTPGLSDIVQNGNPDDIDDPMYIDNGTKTPVVQDTYDRFQLEGADLNLDGEADSWVITLPVIECQNPGDQCAGGDPQDLVGFVCMDVREVLVTPEKIIKVDFLCSSDPRCDNPGLGPGGTLIGSFSAAYPVIVD